jgi:sigma-B regulation protein RsbU (phosphoserine phosphatase)
MDNPRPKVLVVDDTPDNIRVLMESLRDDYAVAAAVNGQRALQLAAADPKPDIILLDVVMPDLDGYAVCRTLKADPNTRDIPVIFVTGQSESEEEALGLTLGAVDYITKPFNPAILKARLANHLALRRAYRELERSQALLAEDLARASQYVASLLPAALRDGPVRADWRFEPCSSLGGDALGYHFPDADHFAFYLLDVCSHGVGPALLSVQALNALRSQTMPGVDFRDPAQVLAGLNALFPMERHNNLYFTIVYGVLELGSRRLTLANAGHPPPLCFAPNGRLDALRQHHLMIGAMPDVAYTAQSLTLEPGSCLYLFSDGVYEVQKPDGNYCTFEEFAAQLALAQAAGGDVPEAVLAWARTLGGSDLLGDDFSILRLAFP